MRHRKGILVFKILVFVVIVLAGFGSAVHYLWNWLMPGIFGLPAINYWQALGLLGLSWLLFGGPRGFMGPHGRRGGPPWRRMSVQERERFRAGMRSRWCGPIEPENKAGESPSEPPPYRDFA